MRHGWAHGVSWGGLVTGPAAWVASTQLNYALVPWVCGHKLNIIPALATALAIVALSGGYVSWRALMSGRRTVPDTEAGGHPYDFLAAISIGMAVLFALVILTQGAAALVFDGCER